MSGEPLAPSNPAHSVFEYLYRDAANYKAWGCVLLRGEDSPSAMQNLTGCLMDASFFVAEQVGVPVLYEVLYAVSGGPTEADHAFHEFVGLRAATREEADTQTIWGSVEDLLRAFRAAKGVWDVSLSRHADLPGTYPHHAE